VETATHFTIKAGTFEGPLDLLLSLIEKRKFFINDVSLAKVADEYMEYVKNLGSFPIPESANFVLVASTLLLIKSKSLLPDLYLTAEEKGDIEDLENRLRIYKEIKDLSVYIKERFGKKLIFQKSETRNATVVFSPQATMTKENALGAILLAIENLPKKERLPAATVKKVMSLEEMIGSLTDRIKASLKVSFRDFSEYGRKEKVHVIVSFLAMLELVKQGLISVSQEHHNADIHMETDIISVPKYGN